MNVNSRLRVAVALCCLVAAGVPGFLLWKQNQAHRQSAAPSVARAKLLQPPGNPAPPVPVRPESTPLPDGILAFNSLSNDAAVIEGDPRAHFTFDFTNISRQDVTILAVDTSCSCTTVETPPLPWTVAPRATGKIPVEMDVEHETGRDLETVTVTTSQGQKELTVVSVISPASTNTGKAGP